MSEDQNGIKMADLSDEDELETDSEKGEDENEQEDVSLSRVYLPGKLEEGEHLECDQSAYVVYHQASTGAPCLSFDIIRDNLGDDRSETFPLTTYLVGGTQSERTHLNNLIVMKFSNITSNQQKTEEESDSDSDVEGENLPELEHAMIPHKGCVNRVKVTSLGGRTLAASWSELKSVYIWDLSRPIEAVDDPSSMGRYVRSKESPKPLFTFKGHQEEGFAMDWSTTLSGVLATGDCRHNIHIWKPQEGGTWNVDQRPFAAHTASVEDLHWSPNEANVLASCSSDRSICIWDTRVAPNKACMLTKSDAHDSDVNVISWNKSEPFIVSGGDDACIKVWDLRQFQKGSPVCIFKHHTAPITSVEWHPSDSTIFAASGEDHQLTLWDLSVERDSNSTEEEGEASTLPPQLLFIHQGQKDIKELHWHPQMPGLVISTAQSGINVFRTISV